jgi:hypothetical protein
VSYLFLDIDGVLNSQLYYERLRDSGRLRTDESDLDPTAIGFLNNFIADTDVEVVISSTWRIGSTVHELQGVLEDSGFEGTILDLTPSLNFMGAVRGNEIYQWIQENVKDYTSIYNDYVIFDDDSDMLLWQKDSFFRTDGYVGLTPNVCYKAANYLKSLK